MVDILKSLSESLRISSARLTLSVMSVFLPRQELSEARLSNDWYSWECLGSASKFPKTLSSGGEVDKSDNDSREERKDSQGEGDMPLRE